MIPPREPRPTWRRREPALEPRGIVALDSCAAKLAQRLLAGPLAGPLEVLAASQVLGVFGASDHLPWCDGVVYVAPQPGCEDLWLPTTLGSVLAPEIVWAACARIEPAPVVLLPSQGRAFPLARAVALDLTQLAQLVELFMRAADHSEASA